MPPAGWNADSRDLAILNVGEDLLGDSVALEGQDELGADGPHGGPADDAGRDARPGMVGDSGEDLARRAVFQKDAADHVHLPQLHGAASLPALVRRQTLSLGLRDDEPVTYEGAVDAGLGRHRVHTASGELVTEADRTPRRVQATQLKHGGLTRLVHLMGTGPRPT